MGILSLVKGALGAVGGLVTGGLGPVAGLLGDWLGNKRAALRAQTQLLEQKQDDALKLAIARVSVSPWTKGYLVLILTLPLVAGYFDEGAAARFAHTLALYPTWYTQLVAGAVTALLIGTHVFDAWQRRGAAKGANDGGT